jgi:hypothetical protein
MRLVQETRSAPHAQQASTRPQMGQSRRIPVCRAPLGKSVLPPPVPALPAQLDLILHLWGKRRVFCVLLGPTMSSQEACPAQHAALESTQRRREGLQPASVSRAQRGNSPLLRFPGHALCVARGNTLALLEPAHRGLVSRVIQGRFRQRRGRPLLAPVRTVQRGRTRRGRAPLLVQGVGWANSGLHQDR